MNKSKLMKLAYKAKGKTAKILKLLDNRNLTLQQIADKMGVKRQWIGAIVKRENHPRFMGVETYNALKMARGNAKLKVKIEQKQIRVTKRQQFLADLRFLVEVRGYSINSAAMLLGKRPQVGHWWAKKVGIKSHFQSNNPNYRYRR